LYITGNGLKTQNVLNDITEIPAPIAPKFSVLEKSFAN